VIEAVEHVAETKVEEWLAEHRSEIDGLKEDARSRYIAIEGAVLSPTRSTNRYPTAIEIPASEKDVYLTGHV
jgi:hypothetical protein